MELWFTSLGKIKRLLRLHTSFEIKSPIEYERKWSRIWKESKAFEADPIKGKPKFFICVPYSYQNGPLHLGHAFTFTRGDVIARFKRMQGYNVMFPWAWHWTGEAVAGTSERLKQGDQFIRKVLIEIDGVPPEIVDKFVDPAYISKYYTEENRKVVEAIGFSVDFRREFYTTDLHPYYSYFIRWQYKVLKDRGYVTLGKHPVVWCPRCQSPTGDHDRLVGEGVSPQEYVIVYFKLDTMYLAAATLRPETIFGVTNIWINPDHEYYVVEVDSNKIVISRRAYEKLSEQKSIKLIDRIDPKTLIGKYVQAPIVNINVPILPANFVDPNFGTGVVYSVPAHAPYDYAGLISLKASKDLDRYGIREIVERIEPISIIKLDGYGDYPAVEVVKRMGIVDDKDPRLEDATKEIYSKEFHGGVMKSNCGEFSGKLVSVARTEVKKRLMEIGMGDTIWELPEKVVCRCGTECLVKIVENQWFLKYSDEEWKRKVREHIMNMRIVPEEARQWFLNVVDWLRDWACTRRTGLGTKLPWDPDWIVETLSDSTIYPALYTISKYLNQGRLKPDHLTYEFLNYVFLGDGDPIELSKKLDLDLNLLREVREEFLYWYPVDMRISAKELVPNHLTFYVFHHVAIFGREHWPIGISVNGMITIEGEKMSKSRGKFIPLKTAIARYGADATRCTLLLAAEDMDDPDWREKNAQDVKQMIEQFLKIVEEVAKVQEPKETSMDAWLISRLQKRIGSITMNLESLKTRKACHEALYEMYNDWRWYIRRTGGEIGRMARIFIENWIKLLAPFIPFTCEEAWSMLGKKSLVSLEAWPIPSKELINLERELEEDLIVKLIEDVRSICGLIQGEKRKLIIYVASKEKLELLKSIYGIVKEEGQRNIGMVIKTIISKLPKKERIAPTLAKIYMDVISSLIPSYEPDTILKVAEREKKVYEDSKDFLSRELSIEVDIFMEDDPNIYDPMNKSEISIPLRPGIYIY